MTSLRNKIIAGVIGIALTGTVGATAIMHDGANTAEETTTTTTTTSTTTATTTTTSTTTTTTTPTTTKEVTTTMTTEPTTTTTTTTDSFIPVKTEPKPEVVTKTFDIDIKSDDMTLFKVNVTNYGDISIYYRRGGTGLDEKWGTIPTALSIVDGDGTKGRVFAKGYPMIGFEGINPLSTTFTLKIAFEDLEEQTIEIVLPDKFKQE